MSEPSREHVEAIAQWVIGNTPLSDYSPDQQSMIREDAASMLEAVTPAVLDAMQDALVRAGRLCEDSQWRSEGVWEESVLMRRLVTEWTEATS